jgi:4-azaleucine resistance transporter AzlC
MVALMTDQDVVCSAPADGLHRGQFRAGLATGVPYAIAGFLLSLSFGVLAVDAGFPGVAAVAMSLIVFAGSAQFAAVSILAAGGGIGAAVGAAALMNARFLPMGVALAPSLPGRAVWRAAQGQAVVDSSWALSNRGDGTFDRSFLFGCSAVQYVTWGLGTLAGVLGGDLLGDPHRFGLDAIYPAFFLSILIAELRAERHDGGLAPLVAAAGALVALALVPFAPPGVPVLAASVVALVGLRAIDDPDDPAVAIGEDVR